MVISFVRSSLFPETTAIDTPYVMDIFVVCHHPSVFSLYDYVCTDRGPLSRVHSVGRDCDTFISLKFHQPMTWHLLVVSPMEVTYLCPVLPK